MRIVIYANINWKHHLKTKHPCYIYSCFYTNKQCIWDRISFESIFRMKKNRHFEKYGGHLEKMKKNYGQQYICKAYTIIMFVWNFHACITICTICPNFQTYISHYLQKIIFKFHHCTVNISYIACTIFDWLLIFCYLTWIWFGGWLKSTYFKVFLSWHSTMYLIWLRDSTAKGH